MDNLFLKSRRLRELFYSDIAEKCNGELKKGLQEYALFLSALHSALCHLENKDLEKFDALVGENACHIRALKIAVISSKNQINFEGLKRRIEDLQGKIEEFLLPKKINFLMSSGISLKEVLEKKDLDVILTSDEIFVFQSFLLGLMKEPQPELLSPFCVRDKSAPKKLKQLGSKVSSKFANSVVRKARRLLSEASVHFTREMAWSLEDAHLIKMVSREFTHEFNSWPCTPMFWTYRTLLKIAQKENIPLIIRVKFLDKEKEEYKIRDQEVLFFKPRFGQGEYSYTLTEPDQEDLKSSALVIQGVVDLDRDRQIFCKMKWKEALAQHSIIDIILAGAADHRQYPDQNREITVYDPEYESYKEIAQKKGFSLQNPTTFFINHVYSLQVGRLFTSPRENSLDKFINSSL